LFSRRFKGKITVGKKAQSEEAGGTAQKAPTVGGERSVTDISQGGVGPLEDEVLASKQLRKERVKKGEQTKVKIGSDVPTK